MNDNLVPLSPDQYGKLMGISKVAACNRARAYAEGKKGLPEGAADVQRMGRVWIIYVRPEMLKTVKI